MARFRGRVQGARGAASRLAGSRIDVHADGWDVGVRVVGLPADGGGDRFEVFATGGSNARARELHVGTVTRVGDDLIFTPPGS